MVRGMVRSESKCSNSRHYSSERSEFHMSNSDSDDDVVDTTLQKHHVKLRTYDGTTSWETFWAHFQSCAKYNRWNTDDKLAHLEASLVGAAGQIL